MDTEQHKERDIKINIDNMKEDLKKFMLLLLNHF